MHNPCTARAQPVHPIDGLQKPANGYREQATMASSQVDDHRLANGHRPERRDLSGSA